MPTAALRDKVGRSAGCPARPILFSKFADDGTPFGFGHQTANQEANLENAGTYFERGIAKQKKGDLTEPWLTKIRPSNSIRLMPSPTPTAACCYIKLYTI
jgi:hypothetical protein